jgi:glycosyltransferase involved in cell wall biosynthesis
LRLLIVSQYFWPEVFRVNDIAAELVARGHEVTVLTGVPNYPDGKVFESYRESPLRFSTYKGAQVIRVPLRPRGQGSARLILNYLSFIFWATLLGPWWLRGRKFDAIFMFETSPITSALPALLLRRLKRAPLLMWVLDLWPDTLAAVGVIRSDRALGLVGKLVAFIYKRCDRILAQSRAFFPNIAHWSGDTSRIRYFPAWAEEAFESDPALVQRATEVERFADTFNVMFAGNLGEAQDFPAILAAAEQLKHRSDVRWLIVGDGRMAAWIRDEIERRGLTERVVMLGRHPLDRMPSFFRAANALLVSLKPDPIFSMTIPGKVQSYLAAGIPLLAMLDGEGARIVQEAGGGLVCPPGDSRALAQTVEQLSALSADRRAEMGSRGRAYCLREFDRATLISRLEAWFAESIEERGHNQAVPLRS